jgi:hypothetical protein
MDMRTRTFEILLAVAALSVDALGQSVPPNIPPPSKVTAPGLRQQPLPGTRAPQPILRAPGAGTVEGFVYWDASQFQHNPASSCAGLAVTVSIGSNSGGPLTAYTPLGTLSNNFTYVGQVKQFLAGGKVNVYDVCTYGYGKVPVGPDLQVQLNVTQPWAFSPVAVPQIAILSPVKIINAQCNMLPNIVKPTSADLFAHWGSCQNMAYDVNFVMHAAPRSSTLGGGGSITFVSGKPAGMLSGTPQQGMLAPGTTQSANGGSGMLGSPTSSNPRSFSVAAKNSPQPQAVQSAHLQNVQAGIVTGWVYWDGSETPTFVSQPPDVSPCDAWQVKLSAGTLVLTATLTWDGGHNNYGFCFYKVDHVPERQPLQLQISLAQPSKSFFQGQWAGFGPLGVAPSGLIIPGGACQSPSFDSPAKATAPNSAAVVCGNHAHNVNFALHPQYEVLPNGVRNSAVAVQH